MKLLFRQGRISSIIQFAGITMMGIFLCAGCKTAVYRDQALNAPGAPAPAVLVDKTGGWSDYFLSKVDNKRASAHRYEILPGEHTLTVEQHVHLPPGPKVTFHFTAKPGETYELNAEWKRKPLLSGSWHAEVTEMSTGQKFASEFIDRDSDIVSYTYP